LRYNEIEPGETVDLLGESPPVLPRPFEGDGGNAADAVDTVLEERMHDVQQGDVGGGAFDGAGGAEVGGEPILAGAEFASDLGGQHRHDLGPGVLR
jgi:hypothetical protein